MINDSSENELVFSADDDDDDDDEALTTTALHSHYENFLSAKNDETQMKQQDAYGSMR